MNVAFIQWQDETCKTLKTGKRGGSQMLTSLTKGGEGVRHGISVKLYTILKCELFFLHKKGINLCALPQHKKVKNCFRNRYVNRATYLLTVIHIMLSAGMWPPPLPAAPIIKLQCSAGFQNLALGSDRESIGLNRAEQFMFEYWSHSR